MAEKKQFLAYVLRLRGKYAEAQTLYEQCVSHWDAQQDADKRKHAQLINGKLARA